MQKENQVTVVTGGTKQQRHEHIRRFEEQFKNPAIIHFEGAIEFKSENDALIIINIHEEALINLLTRFPFEIPLFIDCPKLSEEVIIKMVSDGIRVYIPRDGKFAESTNEDDNEFEAFNALVKQFKLGFYEGTAIMCLLTGDIEMAKEALSHL